MISQKKLVQLTKKWLKIAPLWDRVMFPGAISLRGNAYSSSKPPLADAGHFVVYTIDEQRFVIPLKYLENQIIEELLKMSEEVYGLRSGGPIRLPCDALFMDYVMSVIQNGLSEYMEKAPFTYLELVVAAHHLLL